MCVVSSISMKAVVGHHFEIAVKSTSLTYFVHSKLKIKDVVSIFQTLSFENLV
jgi:hypothetical protein